jgi:hypothetical protein
MLNLLYFKELRSHKNYIIVLVTLIISVIIILKIINKYSYDVYKTYGIVTCEEECVLDISVNYQKTNIFNDYKLKIENQYIEVKDLQYGERYLQNNIPEQEVLLYIDKYEEKIVEVKIEYNKQRIKTKLKKIILER